MTAIEYNYSQQKILIVDDQHSFQVMLKAMLQSFGAQHIQLAHSAEMALKLCKKNQYDLLLIDYNLGIHQNGAQLLEELRATQLLRADTLCFIMSGENHKGMVLNAIDMEPDDFLTKPFSQKQLNKRIIRASLKRQTLLPAYAALAKNQYQTVIDFCQTLIKQNTRYRTLAQSLMVEAFIHQGHYQQAKQLLEHQIAIAPHTRALTSLARVDYLLGKYKDAVDHSLQVIHDNPYMLSAYESLSLAYRDDGHKDKALKVIIRANEISPLSFRRQQIMAELALETDNARLAKDAFRQIMQLARRSIHRGPAHLCNFIRSLIKEAQEEEDLFRKNRLLQEVGNVLYKARHEEGMDRNFDFDAFEGLSQARVRSSKGEVHQAKQILFSTNQNYLQHPDQISDVLLPDTFLALHSVGEYEQAAPLIQELNNRKLALDPIALKMTQKRINDSGFQELFKNFKELNHKGIEAHHQGHYEQAIQLFDKALRLAPGNTDVMLNRIQSDLKILSHSHPPQPHQLAQCKILLNTLEGLKLSIVQAKRLQSLDQEFKRLVSR